MRTSLVPFSTFALASLSVLAVACGGSGGGEPVGSTSAPVTEKCGAPSNGSVQGVDVSDYQGDFDWPGAHVQFGYAQVSDGLDYPDSTFDENWAHMQQAGVLRGAYQYFEPEQDPTSQANMVVAKVGRLGPGDLPAMIDVEKTGGLSAGAVGANVQTWLEVVEKGTGLKPIIYTGSYFWEDSVGTNLSAYPIWIAAYGTSCPSLPDDGWSNWTMWQYSDGGGSLDHDVFNGSIDQLKALSGAPSGPPTARPPSPTGCGAMQAGTGIVAGESTKSCDGRFTLSMQTDGNLVMYLGSDALWDTGTSGSGGYAAVMQTDGNFVLYGAVSNALWASGTSGHPGATLAVQEDGNVVVYEPGGHAGWASGSNLPAAPPSPTACGAMDPGQGLVAGFSHASCDGRFTLAMQTDGNLVLYEGTKALWATMTNGKRGYTAIMQTDGNFVLYDIHSAPLWSSRTSGHDGSTLAIQTDGNLVVYEPGGHPGWASDTCCH